MNVVVGYVCVVVIFVDAVGGGGISYKYGKTTGFDSVQSDLIISKKQNAIPLCGANLV